MKKILKSYLALSVLATAAPSTFADNSCNTNSCSTQQSCGSCNSTSCNGSCTNSCTTSCNSCPISSVFRPRPQGADTARELIGWQTLTHKFDVCDTYLTAALTFQYEQSFNDKNIAKALFGTTQLNFVGSQVANRGNSGTAGCCNLVADYFGLSTTTNASLKINPKIQNFIWDFNFYLGLDSWLEGLYFRFNLPAVWTRWALVGDCNEGSCNTNSNSNSSSCSNGTCSDCKSGKTCNTSCASLVTTGTFVAGYMSAGATQSLSSLQQALSGMQFGAMSEAWKFGKFDFCKRDKGGIADLDMILGYDFWSSECGHFGLYIQAVAPTGPRPSGEFVFEPVVGTHQWKLGGGLTTHYVLWEDNCDQSLSVWLEGNVVHYFKDTQTRSFDFLNSSTTSAPYGCNPMSRYLLLKEFNTDGVTPLGTFINAINFNTRSVKIDIAVEGDASLKFCYRNCNWEVDLGYNIYGKSREKGCFTGAPCNAGCTTSADTLSGRVFGIKGTEGLYSTQYTFSTVAAGEYALSAAGAQQLLNSTENSATMCAPTLTVNVDNAVTTQSAAVGSPVGVGTTNITWNSATTLGSNYTLTNGLVNTNGIIIAQTSNNPVTFTGSTDPKTYLSINSGLACSELTNKVFGLVNYIWRDCDWSPFFGLGATGEFASKRDCTYCGLSKWSVLLKGGISF